MITKKTYIKPYKLIPLCPECGAEMTQNNMMLMTYPPQYSYSCPECRYTETTYENYNEMFYEVVDEEI